MAIILIFKAIYRNMKGTPYPPDDPYQSKESNNNFITDTELDDCVQHNILLKNSDTKILIENMSELNLVC